jgi:site-specific DNA-methyltransferase (adenine-specific)
MQINTIYNIDALTLSSQLKDNVDLIYSDILFGTGNNNFDYDDPVFDTHESITNFYYDIFVNYKKSLKDTGLCYIHCDSKISHNVKIIMDSIFGKQNFRNEIIWNYNSSPRKKKDFGKRHDTIFRYSKSDNYYFNDKSKYIREPYSLSAPRGYEKEKYYSPLGKIKGDVWNIPILGQNDKTERCGYSTQKPLALMYPIIDSSCPENGLCVDFFCGSGTFLVAAKKLGRHYIGCDINEKAIEITRKRLND